MLGLGRGLRDSLLRLCVGLSRGRLACRGRLGLSYLPGPLQSRLGCGTLGPGIAALGDLLGRLTWGLLCLAEGVGQWRRLSRIGHLGQLSGKIGMAAGGVCGLSLTLGRMFDLLRHVGRVGRLRTTGCPLLLGRGLRHLLRFLAQTLGPLGSRVHPGTEILIDSLPSVLQSLAHLGQSAFQLFGGLLLLGLMLGVGLFHRFGLFGQFAQPGLACSRFGLGHRTLDGLLGLTCGLLTCGARLFHTLSRFAGSPFRFRHATGDFLGQRVLLGHRGQTLGHLLLLAPGLVRLLGGIG